jgi:hypothetical protein
MGVDKNGQPHIYWRVWKKGMSNLFFPAGRYEKAEARKQYRDRHKLKNMRGVEAIPCTCDVDGCWNFATSVFNQEVEGVQPGFVDENSIIVDGGKFTALCVKHTERFAKSLAARVTELEDRVDDMQKQLDELSCQVAGLD